MSLRSGKDSAATTLGGAIDDDDVTITVASTVPFPESGVIQIESELISYGVKATNYPAPDQTKMPKY
ncbi:hypothetical protein ACFLYR_07140 [Chloroflexota bacterium]